MGEQTKALHGVGKQGVQPRGEVPSAVSGSQLGAKQVFSSLTLLQALQIEKYNGGVGCQHDFFLPSSKSDPLGRPAVSEI